MVSHIPASYHPELPSKELLSEHTWLQGTFLAAAAYGIEFVLFSMVCYFLCNERHTTNGRKLFFISYNSIIFAISSLYIAILFQHNQLTFIDDLTGSSGDPLLRTRLMDLIYIIVVIKGLVCDAINLWRSFVIYQGCRFPSWLINVVPALLYLASLGLAIRIMVTPLGANILPFCNLLVVSLCFNVLVTFLMAFRILFFRRRITKLMGKRHGLEYVSLTAVLVESAALQSTFALLFITFFNSINSNYMGQTFYVIVSPVQGISTFLIFLRVAQGKAWKQGTYESTMQAVSSIKFTHDTNNGSESQPDGEEGSIKTTEREAV